MRQVRKYYQNDSPQEIAVEWRIITFIFSLSLAFFSAHDKKSASNGFPQKYCCLTDKGERSKRGGVCYRAVYYYNSTSRLYQLGFLDITISMVLQARNIHIKSACPLNVLERLPQNSYLSKLFL